MNKTGPRPWAYSQVIKEDSNQADGGICLAQVHYRTPTKGVSLSGAERELDKLMGLNGNQWLSLQQRGLKGIGGCCDLSQPQAAKESNTCNCPEAVMQIRMGLGIRHPCKRSYFISSG